MAIAWVVSEPCLPDLTTTVPLLLRPVALQNSEAYASNRSGRKPFGGDASNKADISRWFGGKTSSCWQACRNACRFCGIQAAGTGSHTMKGRLLKPYCLRSSRSSGIYFLASSGAARKGTPLNPAKTYRPGLLAMISLAL